MTLFCPTVPQIAHDALARRIVHTDPGAFRPSPAVHGGAGTMRNKPFLDFNGMIAAGKNPAGAFVYDDRAFANIIRGNPQTDVPKGMWHRAHHGGTGTSTRLAMNGYPEMLHNYQPNAELR